jgi:cell division protein ZapA
MKLERENPMPLVNVLVNGRAYTVACDEGEEEHLRELGQYLDKRVRELSATVGQVADSRLLLMAGLVIADELSDAMAKLDERNKELTAIKSAQALAAENLANDDERAADALEFASSRLEAIAARLASA